MGLFNLIMKGIGFETEEDEIEPGGQRRAKKLSWKEKRAMKKAQKLKEEQVFEDKFNVITEAPPIQIDPNSFAMNKDQFNTVDLNAEGGTMGKTGYTQTFNPYGSYNQKNFVFFTPKNYEDVKKLIEYLKQTEPAIVNLDGITDAEAQRILDFVSGGVCALNGSIQRIKGNIFLVAPDGFNIMVSKSDIKEN